MDVRCEKCQTEYELDEARLKPGGVTVKCTHCGHTFKVRKRTITNVGTAAASVVPAHGTRPRTGSSKQPLRNAPEAVPFAVNQSLPALPTLPALPARPARPDSLFDDEGRPGNGDDATTAVDRQWLIRLEN